MIEDRQVAIENAAVIIDADGLESLATIQDRTQAVGDGQADDAATSIRQDAFPSPAPSTILRDCSRCYAPVRFRGCSGSACKHTRGKLKVRIEGLNPVAFRLLPTCARRDQTVRCTARTLNCRRFGLW
jgi:hypothetical protein